MDGESAEEDDVTGIGRENQSQRGWDGVDGDKVNLLKGTTVIRIEDDVGGRTSDRDER